MLLSPFLSDLLLALRLAAAEPHFSWNIITLISVVDIFSVETTLSGRDGTQPRIPLPGLSFSLKTAAPAAGKSPWENNSSKHPFFAHLLLFCPGCFHPQIFHFTQTLTVGVVRALIKPSVPVAGCWDLFQPGWWWWTLSLLALSDWALLVLLVFGWVLKKNTTAQVWEGLRYLLKFFLLPLFYGLFFNLSLSWLHHPGPAYSKRLHQAEIRLIL